MEAKYLVELTVENQTPVYWVDLIETDDGDFEQDWTMWRDCATPLSEVDARQIVEDFGRGCARLILAHI